MNSNNINLHSKPREDEQFEFEVDIFTFYPVDKFWEHNFIDLENISYSDLIKKMINEGYSLNE